MSNFGRRSKPKKSLFENTISLWNRNVNRVFQKSQIDDLFWDEQEESLIVADISVSVSLILIQQLREYAHKNSIIEPGQIYNVVKEHFVDFLSVNNNAAPLKGPKKIILFLGVNGSGKTTTLAKVASYSCLLGYSVLIAAADTFRAAAREQLEQWASKIGVDVISNPDAKDPSSVVYDAIKSTRSKDLDFLMIDTAGRLHTSNNLMAELDKIYRTASKNSQGYEVYPILIMDSTVGNNGIVQARKFHEVAPCKGIIMTKLDGTSRGGALISITHELGIPVLFIGTGEDTQDLVEFNPRVFVEHLLPNT